MRSEIEIPRGGDGAKVFFNRGGGVSITQLGIDGEQLIALTVDEALSVASALLEVAETIKAETAEGTDENS